MTVVTVWGPRGAPGRTTVAVGLAYECARSGEPTVLVDADCEGGAIAQLLGIEHASPGEIVPSWHPQLRVAAGVRDRKQAFQIPSIASTIENAREHGTVVIDVRGTVSEYGRDFFADPDDWTLDAVEAADTLVVVGLPDPVGLSRLTDALLSIRDRQGEVVVVVNRMRPSLGWGVADIAAMLTGIVRTTRIHALPLDQAACDRALLAGRPVAFLATDAPISRGFADIARACSLGCHQTIPTR